LAGRDKETS